MKEALELIKNEPITIGRKIDIIESSFFDSDKDHIFYIYDMARATTTKEGGLIGIDELIDKISKFNKGQIRTTILKMSNGEAITVLSDTNYLDLIGTFIDL